MSEYFVVNNFAQRSNSNLKILNSFKETAEDNSTCVIQWSSLTRPNDFNFSLLQTSDNPLWDLLDEWYEMIEEALLICKERNIKLIQYIGWAHWKTSELNEYHINKLLSFDITWFDSAEQLDIIVSNCFQFQTPKEWSSESINNEFHLWSRIEFGGMAEWIRTNIDMYQRYIGYNAEILDSKFDTHPSEFATLEFVSKFLIPNVKLLNKLN
jgi:hypothetical protein